MYSRYKEEGYSKMKFKSIIERYEQAIFFYNYIVEIADEVTSILGNGYEEKIYQKAMEFELKERYIDFKAANEFKDKSFKTFYKGKELTHVEPDLIIHKQEHSDFRLNEPIIIEMKRDYVYGDARSKKLGQLNKYMRCARSITDKTHYAYGAVYGIYINFSVPRLSLSHAPENDHFGETPYIKSITHENITELWNFETRVHSLTKSELEKYKMHDDIKLLLEKAIDKRDEKELLLEELVKDQSQEDMDEWLNDAEFIDENAMMIAKKKKPILTIVKNIDN